MSETKLLPIDQARMVRAGVGRPRGRGRLIFSDSFGLQREQVSMKNVKKYEDETDFMSGPALVFSFWSALDLGARLTHPSALRRTFELTRVRGALIFSFSGKSSTSLRGFSAFLALALFVERTLFAGDGMLVCTITG
jgi:hypothetical protein